MNRGIQRLGAAILLICIAFMLPETWIWGKVLLYFAAYLIAGYDVLLTAFRDIQNRQPFGECFLMTVATLGAFGAGLYHSLYPKEAGFPEEYLESVAVMLFYQIGELFQHYAVGKSRKSIGELMDIRPDYAYRLENGERIRIDPYDAAVGDVIVVSPGEKVPLDGVVLEGGATMDTAALTGESLPKRLEIGDAALSGYINKDGIVQIKVEKEFGDSTASKILDLVENAASAKAKTERFITRFARIYTPIVVCLALAIAVIFPLFTGEWLKWIMRALNFLIVSCPCALVVSVPLSFFGGIGGASKKGILVKGSNYFESLSKAGIVAWDKTGTLTEGKFSVREIHPVGLSENELLELAILLERHSHHPISVSLVEEWKRRESEFKPGSESFAGLRKIFDRKEGWESEKAMPENFTELSGHGITAQIYGKTVAVGNAKLMKLQGISTEESGGGTKIHISIDSEYAGYISMADRIKEDAKLAVRKLRALGIQKLVMLTGDQKRIGEEVARELGLDEVYTELLPMDKVSIVRELMEKKGKNETLLFVGDGINDAPVLAASDVGIAMGGIGSDAAIEAADVVIMQDEPSKLATAIQISRRTVNIAMQNIIGAIAIKILILILSLFGIAHMWMAIFGDVGVTVLAILNAFRALYLQKH